MFHDASTLGGNSGSAVIDLETNQVIALHFGGAYLRYNQSVALWPLADDPLLVRAGVQFD
jgi:V8-like Glu-specific endopeptidase